MCVEGRHGQEMGDGAQSSRCLPKRTNRQRYGSGELSTQSDNVVFFVRRSTPLEQTVICLHDADCVSVQGATKDKYFEMCLYI